ncbi:hypothetical protein M8C21_005364 [Ambrosia artemisiifolia]|uniref:ACB domain-containing protein n=1 Tax=Ambrosia artemisiifolia TaxID=4212 RepID=A0AAD5CJG2_AMBAR|nr:hypothetical protein M8C21_005364 [Ambrosia artemisiifolia]
MAMARVTSGLAYPDRFYAAATYAGFGSSSASVTSKFSNDVALLLYALYQQATVGPCNLPKPRAWSPVEHSKWTSWNGLGNMASSEAMRLFVKILEEEDPGWYSRVSDFIPEPVVDVEMNHNSKAELPIKNESTLPEVKTIPAENGNSVDKDVMVEVIGSVGVYDQWVAPPVSGPRPKPRYEVSRGGQSVTLVGNTLVIFGGQDGNRTLLNDLHILDLETMTWDEIDTIGVSPSPRSDHAAAVHAERYLLIFGGGTHSTCFNDLHVLDLKTMEWSKPSQQGEIPSPRAGHAGVTVGESWFIVGGGDNKSGASETVVLNMSTLSWSVVTTVQGRVPLASEGLSLVLSSCNGEDILVSFGGYNGRYNNEVNLLKPSYKSTLQATRSGVPALDSVSGAQNATNGTRDVDLEFEAGQEAKFREISMENKEPQTSEVNEVSERSLAALKAEKEELESALSNEKSQSNELKQELIEAESKNSDLYKELQSLRVQLAAEQSRCFKLEVDVAELRQKLQTMDSLQKELEILQRQKAASEEAYAKQKQSSGGVWSWLAGTPPPTQKATDA